MIGRRRGRSPEISETALELAHIAEERLGELAIGRDNVSESVDRIVDELTDQGRVILLRQLFDSLPVDQRYAILANTFDDAGIKAALGEHRELASENAVLESSMVRLRHDARRRNIVDTRNILPYMTVQLDLHDVADFRNTGSYDALYEAGCITDWRISMSAERDGLFRILESNVDAKNETGLPSISPHTIVRIGSPAVRSQSELNPILHWGAPVHVSTEAYPDPVAFEFEELDLAIGGVLINSQRIFESSD